MKHEPIKKENFHKKFHNQKDKIKNSLFEVECFLDKSTKLSDIFKVFKILKKNKH